MFCPLIEAGRLSGGGSINQESAEYLCDKCMWDVSSGCAIYRIAYYIDNMDPGIEVPQKIGILLEKIANKYTNAGTQPEKESKHNGN